MQQKYKLTPDQARRFKELRKMSPDAYEKICKGCGLCCLCKTGCDGFTLYTRLYCNYLDINTKRCKIYNSRLKDRANQCAKVTPELALAGDLVPRTCGYVEYIFGPAKEPINLDWSSVVHCGNMDVGDTFTALGYVILDSINWKQR